MRFFAPVPLAHVGAYEAASWSPATIYRSSLGRVAKPGKPLSKSRRGYERTIKAALTEGGILLLSADGRRRANQSARGGFDEVPREAAAKRWPAFSGRKSRLRLVETEGREWQKSWTAEGDNQPNWRFKDARCRMTMPPLLKSGLAGG